MTHQRIDLRTNIMWRHAATIVALGALLIASGWRVARTHRRRRETRSAPLSQPLQNWEDEGGRPAPAPTLEGAGLATTTAGALRH